MSWNCRNCQAVVDDELDLCWQCGTGRDGSPAPANWQLEQAPLPVAVERDLDCLRCQSPMVHAGRKRFHEGSYWADLLGGDLFIDRQVFDVYACSGCGKVEFFIVGTAT